MNKTTEALKRVEVWVESLTGLHTDVRQEQGEILAAIREVLAEPVCEHRIADARNEFVRDGYICIKCGALFRAAFHAEPVKQEPVAFKFVRYVNGKEMAEGVTIERETTLDAAIKKAVSLCPDRAKTVLVYAAPVSFEAAVLAEREACAKIAERFEPDEKCNYVKYASAAIRARGEK